jgi:hypothetical protein
MRRIVIGVRVNPLLLYFIITENGRGVAWQLRCCLALSSFCAIWLQIGFRAVKLFLRGFLFSYSNSAASSTDTAPFKTPAMSF